VATRFVGQKPKRPVEEKGEKKGSGKNLVPGGANPRLVRKKKMKRNATGHNPTKRNAKTGDRGEVTSKKKNLPGKTCKKKRSGEPVQEEVGYNANGGKTKSR